MYMDYKGGLWRKLSAEELMLLNCGAGEDSWESLGLQGNPKGRDSQLLVSIELKLIQLSSVHSLSRVRLFATPWITARQASLSITNSRSSLKLTSIESVMPSNYLILCHPLLLLPSPSPPTLNLSQHQNLFKWASSSHEVAKVLEFQLQHQSFQ